MRDNDRTSLLDLVCVLYNLCTRRRMEFELFSLGSRCSQQNSRTWKRLTERRWILDLSAILHGYDRTGFSSNKANALSFTVTRRNMKAHRYGTRAFPLSIHARTDYSVYSRELGYRTRARSRENTMSNNESTSLVIPFKFVPSSIWNGQLNCILHKIVLTFILTIGNKREKKHTYTQKKQMIVRIKHKI